MPSIRIILVFFIFANLLINNLLAQSAELGNLYTQKQTYQQQKDYKNAKIAGEKMLALAEKEFGKTGFYANYAFDLAALWMEMQDYAAAQKLYEEALAIYEKEQGKDHEYTASAWMSLGYALQMQNKLQAAEKAYQSAYSIYQTKLGKTHQYTQTARNLLTQAYQNNQNYQKLIPLVESELADLQPDTENYAITLNNLGYFCEQIDDFIKSEKYYNESLSLLAKLKGKNSEDYAVTHHNLALLYKKQNKFLEAQKIFEQNAQLYEKLYGKNHPKYLRNLNNVALMQEEQNQFVEAEKLYQAALSAYQKIGYQDSMEFAETTQNFAGLQRERGNLPNAIQLYQKAIQIYEKNQQQNSQGFLSASNNLALTFSENAQYTEAEKMYQKNLQVLEKLRGKENFDYAAALNGLADLYEKIGKYAQAEPLFVNSLGIMEKITGKFHPDYATALNNLAYLCKLMGKNDLSEVKFKETLAILEQLKLKKSPQYAAALQNYGLLLQAMGKYPKAESNLKESLLINQSIYGEVHPDVGTVLNDLGLLFNNKGQFTYAEQYLRKSLNVKELTLGKTHPSYATSLINTGIFYFEKGEYGIAERMTREAMKIYEAKFGKEHPFYATALVNLGNIYRVYGDWNNAMRSFTEAAHIQAKTLGENHPDWVNTANFIGILFREVGDFKEAEEIFEKCRQIREKMFGKNHPEYAESLINLADTYSHVKRYDEAEKYYLSALKICEEVFGKNSSFYPIYLNNLAVLYLKQKKSDKALAILLEVKALREKLFSPKHPEYINVLSNLADTYRVLQKNDQAEKLYLQVNDLILAYIRDIFPYLSEKEQESFYRIFRYFYLTNFYSFAVMQAKTKPQLLASIYDNQLTTKLLLFSTATDLRQAVLKSNNPELLKNFEELTAKKEYLAKLYRLTDEELKKQEINLVEIEKATNELDKKINSSFRITSPTYTWQDIQKKLKPNEAVIEMLEVDMSLTEDEKDSLVYVALLITPQTKNYPQMILLPNGNELKGRALKFYQNSIKFKKEDKLSYKQFWEPIAKIIPPLGDRGLLYFSPDGVYNQINLNTLYNPETKKHLMEELDIQLLANSRDLLKPDKPLLEKRELKAELFGFPDYEQRENKSNQGYEKRDKEVKTITNDTTSRYANFREIVDLPGTKTEVETIEQILKTKKILTQSHLQANATEEAIKSLRNLHLLHIATHGFFLNDEQIEEGGLDQKVTENLKFNPLLRSGLLLAGCKQTLNSINEGGAEDGILTAYEAANLNLENTDLVVLSACETGLGEVRNGEGVYGLQRAFLTAGAKTLLMSLWTVSDEATQVLMTNFYRNWMQSNNKREAFKKAQIELREKYPQPYFWGAFVMVGE